MTPNDNRFASNAFETLRASPLVQAAVIFLVVLVLQIPILFISELVRERDQTRLEAIAEISASWGGPQTVAGPFLVVPYTEEYVQYVENTDRTLVRVRQSTATFLAADLTLRADLETQTRYRGIYEAPVYTADFELTGAFEKPDFSDWDVDPARIQWNRAYLALEISDARAVQTGVRMSWRGADLEVEPGANRPGSDHAGIHAETPLDSGAETFPFRIAMSAQGGQSVRFAPLAEETTATIAADWTDPSFQGAWLPQGREVRDDGFTAAWRIPHLGRDYPQRWRGTGPEDRLAASLFGVDLLTPVDAYRQSERSLKYQLLFTGLTFITIWLFEVLSGARVHLIQYGLVGAALCLFYLLELSLAEHISFPVAYWLAAATVVGMVFGYGRSAFGSAGRAATVGGVLAGLYGCLFVLLKLQDFALLIGSIGLTVILAAIMFATRKVDWYAPRGVRTTSP